MKYIETERLILRDWLPKDLEPFTKLNQDQRVMEFFPNLLTQEEVALFIQGASEQIKQDGFGLFACEIKVTGQFIGFVGIKSRSHESLETDFTPCIEIGWRIAYEYWGKGYATEAALKSLEFGFKTIKLKEILAWTTEKNIRSKKIMEKIGMKYVKNFHHTKLPLDHNLSLHVLYSIKKEEYETLK